MGAMAPSRRIDRAQGRAYGTSLTSPVRSCASTLPAGRDLLSCMLPHAADACMFWRNIFLAVLLVSATGCVAPQARNSRAATAAMEGDATRPSAASGWVRSELYFGVGTEGDAASTISEARWQAFLDQEVTPRFPDGLTVFDAYGQWRFRGEAGPQRQRSKVLVILHEDTPQRRADIEAIRRAWKQATQHQSVLWSQQPATVSF